MKILKAIGFWVWSFIWGLPITLVGCAVALVLLITGHKPHRFYYSIYFEVGERWGGFECGPFFVTNKDSTLHLKQHEAGHGLQNLWWGFLMPFVISIPSMIRYWYREIIFRTNQEKYCKLPPYDSIWFEGQATRLGEKYFPEQG